MGCNNVNFIIITKMQLEKDKLHRSVGALLILNKVSQSQLEEFVNRLNPELRQPCRNALYNVRKNLEFISEKIYDKGLNQCELQTKANFNEDFFLVEDFLITFINE